MEEESWVLEVDDGGNKISEIITAEKKDWDRHSIYKLPACVTDLNHNAYKPRAISFGPYHYGDPKLKPMEAHKHRALIRFLTRSRKCLDYYINMLNGATAKDLMDAYDCLDSKWRQDPKGFLTMMVRDGCFMLELWRASYALSDGVENGRQWLNGYADNDPIFSNHGKLHMMPYIKRDMLMLENQLPMLLLTKLLSAEHDQLTKEDEQLDDYINKLVVEFCSPDGQYFKLGKCKHVLDVYRKVLLGDDQQLTGVAYGPLATAPLSTGGDDILPSATHLYEAGISIRKSGTSSIRDISFDGGIFNGVLRIPPMIVDDITEPVFLNLMAFERFHVGIGNEVTSYISFMVDVIEDERDVNLLHYKEIVRNACGSGRAAAKLFNSLGKDISLDPDSKLFQVRSNARKYCKRHWNRWRGNLVHTYFKSPWSAISLIAAIFLFGLTFFDILFNNK